MAFICQHLLKNKNATAGESKGNSLVKGDFLYYNNKKVETYCAK